ncbi:MULTISPECIES: nuclear transport factor 2 family protein [unclassified Streptomyces]|uniref:nuclear transport factor 2 family protein n=1 Tax=unclassified Streptomyces TaxID=2593676 RepID=UPI0014895D50|nr:MULTISPECIES: nuclear transport factor 2 family protein [unclassified Streptomyces]
MHPFRQAVEHKNIDAVEALLADDVVFTSPVVFKPYTGKAITTAILRAVSEVFQDFSYEREIGAPDARDHALIFTATVAGKQLQGCDFLRMNEDGKIAELMVMVRPLSAAKALAEEMGARFDAIAREAAGT